MKTKIHKRRKLESDKDTSEDESTEEEDVKCISKKNGKKIKKLSDKSLYVKWKNFGSIILDYCHVVMEGLTIPLDTPTLLNFCGFVCSAAIDKFGKIDLTTDRIVLLNGGKSFFRNELEHTLCYASSDSCSYFDTENFESETNNIFIFINCFGILDGARTSDVDRWSNSRSNIIDVGKIRRAIGNSQERYQIVDTNCKCVRIAVVSILNALARIDLFLNGKAQLNNNSDPTKSIYGNIKVKENESDC